MFRKLENMTLPLFSMGCQCHVRGGQIGKLDSSGGPSGLLEAKIAPLMGPSAALSRPLAFLVFSVYWTRTFAFQESLIGLLRALLEDPKAPAADPLIIRCEARDESRPQRKSPGGALPEFWPFQYLIPRGPGSSRSIPLQLSLNDDIVYGCIAR